MSGHNRRRPSSMSSESKTAAFLSMRPLCEPCSECGKLRYFTRKAAKAARKRTNQGESMSVYRCGEFWHIGHTPWQIREGLQERSNLHNQWVPR